MKETDEISGDVIDLAIRIHHQLGPGLLESVYEAVLTAKLQEIGYIVARQQPIDILFEGLRFKGAVRADLIVDGRLIVEIKSVERLTDAHAKQLLTYLGLVEQSVGPLISLRGRRSRRDFGGSSTTTDPPPRLRVNQPPSSET